MSNVRPDARYLSFLHSPQSSHHVKSSVHKPCLHPLPLLPYEFASFALASTFLSDPCARPHIVGRISCRHASAVDANEYTSSRSLDVSDPPVWPWWFQLKKQHSRSPKARRKARSPSEAGHCSSRIIATWAARHRAPYTGIVLAGLRQSPTDSHRVLRVPLQLSLL